MQELLNLLERELTTERAVTDSQLLGINRHYSISDFDQLKAFIEKRESAAGEQLDLFMILSYNFTPDLADQTRVSPLLDSLSLSAKDVENVIQNLEDRTLIATLGFRGNPLKIKAPLEREVIARYVRNLRLDSPIVDSLRKVIGELIPETDQAKVKAIFRDEVWQNAPWSEEAIKILYALSKRKFRVEKLIYLTRFITSNRPKNLLRLIELIKEVIESYETEVRRLEKGAKMFFNDMLRESYDGSESDQRDREQQKLDEQKREMTEARDLAGDLEGVSVDNPQIIRTSFGLKNLILEDLDRDYKSSLVDEMKSSGNRLVLGDLEFRIAEEFGFCYGVDKAVDFAYQTLKQFPGKRILITNEIIHNPRVNLRLRALGIHFLEGPYASGMTLEDVSKDDVVLIPAFGATVAGLDRLKATGCVLVDTTCGSVVHVWKRVEKYAKDGFTAVIHGKFQHEETMATSSQVTQYSGGKFLIVRDKDQAEKVCRYIERGGNREEFLQEFQGAVSQGFDPDHDLERVGCANQTTMLSSESLDIARMLREVLAARYGAPAIETHFRSYDTICSATQDRQDAVQKLAQSDVDLILVIGGYNSSNTTHLAEISSTYKPAYHIEDADDIVSVWEIRHQLAERHEQIVSRDWLPVGRAVIGLTAGASTPNRVIEDVIRRIHDLREWLPVANAGCCDI